MENNFTKIQALLEQKAELKARLNLIPYDGAVEIKEVSGKKYIYIRKREIGKKKSDYVGVYSDELYSVLLKSVKDAKELKKSIRAIEKELAKCGYTAEELPANVVINIDFARCNIKSIIYDQAVLEGVGTTFPDTEIILDNGKVNNVSAEDVQKILNLKHAWEFILDKDIILSPTNYYMCQYIAKLVNEGFYFDGGRIRAVPVSIGGSSYVPPLPQESDVKRDIEEIEKGKDATGVAIELVLYIMKTQVFNDGNKRTAIIFANHYLISHGAGLIVVPENLTGEFKKLLVDYYEGIDEEKIRTFLREKCLRKVN